MVTVGEVRGGRHALIFDCDGVLSDTEPYGHLPAFNRMFQELNIPAHWSTADYRRMLKIGGGKERLLSLLTPKFVVEAALPAEREAQIREVARWHRHKTEIYTRMVAGGLLPARSGVARLVEEAWQAGWRLAVASTSSEPSVRAVLEYAVGAQRAADFVVVAGDMVGAKKPAPDAYLLALAKLDTTAECAVAVEDSRNGLMAAVGAGLRCIVTVSAYTAEEDFSAASLVVTSLGDPDMEHAVVLQNRSLAEPDGWITISDVERILPRATDAQT